MSTHEQENEMRRHFAVMKQYPGSVSWDEQKAYKQAERGLNAALDVYPNGKRPDISLERAHEIARLGDTILQDTIDFEQVKV